MIKKTDKDGKIIYCCEICNNVIVKFWNDIETVRDEYICKNCGNICKWNSKGESK